MADGALDELAAVRQEVVRDGWSAVAVGRAVAAFRVAGAVALGQPPAVGAGNDRPRGVGAGAVGAGNDRPRSGGAGDVGAGDVREGQLLVRRGRKRTAGAVRVSSAVTPERLDGALPELRPRRPRDAHLAEIVRDALRQFGAVRYGRPGDIPAEPLTEQLDRTADALAVRARESAPAVRRIGPLRRAVEAWERAWAR